MADDAERQVPEGAAVFPLIPPELGVQPLLLALLHTVVFLEGSEDDVVHSAAAGEALEYVATYLQRLSEAELRRVREDLECLAVFGRSQQWSRQQVRFLKELLDTYGVGDEGTA
jgi:hypothetical protein